MEEGKEREFKQKGEGGSLHVPFTSSELELPSLESPAVADDEELLPRDEGKPSDPSPGRSEPVLK